MGPVYRPWTPVSAARVTVKVLPPQFSADPERISRFAQEASAAVALVHPHIAAVYDIGIQGQTQYMVQKYSDNALRARLTEHRNRPIAEWLPIAADIASALAAAHQPARPSRHQAREPR